MRPIRLYSPLLLSLRIPLPILKEFHKEEREVVQRTCHVIYAALDACNEGRLCSSISWWNHHGVLLYTPFQYRCKFEAPVHADFQRREHTNICVYLIAFCIRMQWPAARPDAFIDHNLVSWWGHEHKNDSSKYIYLIKWYKFFLRACTLWWIHNYFGSNKIFDST